MNVEYYYYLDYYYSVVVGLEVGVVVVDIELY
jgi:hypothetical protein